MEPATDADRALIQRLVEGPSKATEADRTELERIAKGDGPESIQAAALILTIGFGPLKPG